MKKFVTLVAEKKQDIIFASIIKKTAKGALFSFMKFINSTKNS